MQKSYVHYGCGLAAPDGWMNFDVSPTLRIQKIPLLGSLVKGSLNTVFPDSVNYGNIITGLPVANNSCDGIYCSHTLEHLSLNDFRKALLNTKKILKKGGLFRCIVPDMEHVARTYVSNLDQGKKDASITFINDTLMGVTERPKGFKGFLAAIFGASNHLWMWDEKSMEMELEKAGFTNIRLCAFDDSKDDMFKQVESEDRFIHSIAFECTKN